MHRSRADDERTLAILAEVDAGHPLPEIARRYGITPNAVRMVYRRVIRTWEHSEREAPDA